MKTERERVRIRDKWRWKERSEIKRTIRHGRL